MPHQKCILNILIPLFAIPLFAEEIQLPPITTYIDGAVVEQKMVLTSEEIQEKHTESLTSLLQSQGIQILAYGAYGLQQVPSIRGFTDETVRVVIDGVCVNNAQYGTFDFSSININDIERLEIIKGGFTEGVCDEGAVGGVIYITTKKQQLGTHFNSDSAIKTFLNTNLPVDTVSQNIGMNIQTGENTFFKASVKETWANNQFLFLSFKNQLLERENSAVQDANSNLQLTHYFGNGNYFWAGNLFYIGNKNVPGTENAAFTGIQNDLSNKITLGLNFPSINNCVRLENTFAWLCDNRTYQEKDDLSIHHVNSFKFSSSAAFCLWNIVNQTAGLSLDFTKLNSTDDGKHFQFCATVKETSKIHICDFFDLSIPLAVKICNNNFAFVPKAGALFSFSHVNFTLDAYRMVQFPNMDDLYWAGGGFRGNPNLKPESGLGADLSINVHDFVLPFTLCFYTNYYKNKIQWNLSTRQAENISSAFYAGIDFSLKQTFWNFLTVQANLEYLYNRLLDRSNELTYGKRIMWTPDLTASAGMALKFSLFSWSVDASYTGKRYTSNLNVFYLEPFVLLNSSLEFCKFNWITPYIRAENLLNSDYEAAENYPMPRMSITFGVKLQK